MRYGWTGRAWGMLGLGATLMLGLGTFGGNAAGAAPRWRDMDRDGIVDSRDRDRDGDGVLNARDRYPDDPRRTGLEWNRNGSRYTWDRGRDHGRDTWGRDRGRTTWDRDRDGLPNWRDRDRDGDRVPNRYDRRPNVYGRR
jgi:hypothetical protein